jgi:hypothetical protein
MILDRKKLIEGSGNSGPCGSDGFYKNLAKLRLVENKKLLTRPPHSARLAQFYADSSTINIYGVHF